MRVLVTGGRHYADREFLYAALDALHAEHGFRLLIHGGATGADALAQDWAEHRGVVPQAYPADWTKYRKAAGPIRNRQMLDEGKPDLVVAFPGGDGTANMVSIAKRAGVPVIQP